MGKISMLYLARQHPKVWLINTDYFNLMEWKVNASLPSCVKLNIWFFDETIDLGINTPRIHILNVFPWKKEGEEREIVIIRAANINFYVI